MFSSANKIAKTTPAVQQKAAGSTFFRKAGEDSFFASKEKPSFFGSPIQTKLTVSTPDDPQEKEADAVAQKVMTMPQPAMETAQPENTGEKLERKEDEHYAVQLNQEMPGFVKIDCKAQPEQLHAISNGTVSRLEDAGREQEQGVGPKSGGQTIDRKKISLYQSDIMRQSGRGPPAAFIPFEQTLFSSKGSGSALPDDTRTFMESRFNADFSGVRIHTDSTAQQLSTSVNAQAFAHGNDIFFNKGKFAPQTSEGGTLLAHELTHTIQQGASKSGVSKKSGFKPVGIQRQSFNIGRLPDAHSATGGEQLIETKIASGGQPLYRHSPLPQSHQTAISAPSENIINQKPKQDEAIDEQGVADLQPSLAQPLTTTSANTTNVSTPKANTPALANKSLQTQLEGSLADNKKYSSEIETDVHIRQKGMTSRAMQIQCCSCDHGDEDGEVAIQTKENLQLPYIANANGGLMEANTATTDRGPPLTIQRAGERVQRSVIDDALSFVGSLTDCIPSILDPDIDAAIRCAKGKAKQVAMHIPGYKALRVVLGEDPITGEEVARNGRNFIEAAFDLVPGGDLLHQKLDEIHKLDAAAAWIDGKIATIVGLVSGLKTAIVNFWDSIGITDIASPMDVLRRGVSILTDFVGKVIDFAIDTAKDLLKMVKDFLLDKMVDFIKTKTTAYPLLTVILGKDPITEKEVATNGTNILNALLDLGGDEGKEQKKQMQDTGTFGKAADFIDEGVKVFGTAYTDIVAAFHNIWDAVSISSLMDPAGTFAKIYNGFAVPIGKVWDFVKKVGAVILKLVKDVLMTRLSVWAKTVRGYSLVTVIIGKDPFTNAEVTRNVENIVHGFMSLMDGGEEQFTQLKDSGAIAKAEQKINAAVKQLNLTPQAIVQLFIDLWNSFSINDLAHPIAAFERILAKFGEPIGRLIAFVVEIIKIVVEVLLAIMQFPMDLVNNIIAKAMEAFQKIKSDPIGFLKNLLRAIKEGFSQFFGNIVKHLLAGLAGWLISEMKDANVEAPKDFSLASIIGWVLKLLGITVEKIWEKLAKHPKIGPARVAKIRGMIGKLEGIWTFIKDVQERGMAAIWDKIVEKLNNLWNTVLDAVENWVMEQIVNKIVTKLLSMLDPTGIMAVINSVIALYKAIQSFMKYLKEMLQIVNSFVEGVVEIANGNAKRSADTLENTLGKGMPVVIGFLANQVGLSGVGKKVGEMIEKVRDMVDSALTWLVNKAVDTGLGLLDKVMGTSSGADGKDGAKDSGKDGSNPDDANIDVVVPFAMKNSQHTLTAKVRNKKVELIMASDNPTNLNEALQTAITYLTESKPDNWQALVKELQTCAKDVESDNIMIEDFNASGGRIAGSGGTLSLKDYITTKLTIVTKRLFEVAAQYNISGLEKFFMDVPEKRYLPRGYDVRAKLYYRGGTWASVRKQLIDRQLSQLRQDVISIKNNNDTAAFANLIAQGQIPEGSILNSFKPDSVMDKSIQYAVDHNHPLSAHWQRDGGNNAKDSDRWNEAVREDNLRVIHQPVNSSKGSTVGDDPSDKASWVAWVGLDFVSQYANDNQPKSKKIDGQPFLTESGTPII